MKIFAYSFQVVSRSSSVNSNNPGFLSTNNDSNPNVVE